MAPEAISTQREKFLLMPEIEGQFSVHPGHSQVSMVIQKRAHSFAES
jgi:hypothetical protein